MNPDEFMNIKQVTVLLKRTAMSGPYACGSNRNVNALGLSEILTTLKPVFYIMTLQRRPLLANVL